MSIILSMARSMLLILAAVVLLDVVESQIDTQVVPEYLPISSVTSVLTMTGLDGQTSTVTHVLSAGASSGSMTVGGTGLPPTSLPGTSVSPASSTSVPMSLSTTSAQPVAGSSTSQPLIPNSGTASVISAPSGTSQASVSQTAGLTSPTTPALSLTTNPIATDVSSGTPGPTTSGPGGWATSGVVVTATDGQTTSKDLRLYLSYPKYTNCYP